MAVRNRARLCLCSGGMHDPWRLAALLAIALVLPPLVTEARAGVMGDDPDPDDTTRAFVSIGPTVSGRGGVGAGLNYGAEISLVLMNPDGFPRIGGPVAGFSRKSAWLELELAHWFKGAFIAGMNPGASLDRRLDQWGGQITAWLTPALEAGHLTMASPLFPFVRCELRGEGFSWQAGVMLKVPIGLTP